MLKRLIGFAFIIGFNILCYHEGKCYAENKVQRKHQQLLEEKEKYEQQRLENLRMLH